MISNDEPIWRGDRFKAIDDSVSTLVISLAKAVAGMFTAFAAAHWTAVALGLGPGVLPFAIQGGIFAAFGCVAIFLTSARPIRAALRAQREAILQHEADLVLEASRHAFASSVQDAFEMVEREEDALDVVSRGLGVISSHPAELLLADSSRAHLRRVAVSTATESPPGCMVDTPWRCPAVRRGQTLEFPSSEALSACPRLAERGREPCGATCVPVVVLGSPMGVIHTTRPLDQPSDPQHVIALENLAMQAGFRIGVLRAMARSERQAATDSLTGHLNRRSLESEIGRLRDSGLPYATVVADLDHFKNLNDTFGHETGDRALRLFARTIDRSVRTGDIVCRYGGEEFVLILPHVGVIEASAVVHRIREELKTTLDSGDVPHFTASFGIADSTHTESFEEIFRLADAALYRAKQLGRDRLIIADDDSEPISHRGHPSPLWADLSVADVGEQLGDTG